MVPPSAHPIVALGCVSGPGNGIVGKPRTLKRTPTGKWAGIYVHPCTYNDVRAYKTRNLETRNQKPETRNQLSLLPRWLLAGFRRSQRQPGGSAHHVALVLRELILESRGVDD